MIPLGVYLLGVVVAAVFLRSELPRMKSRETALLAVPHFAILCAAWPLVLLLLIFEDVERIDGRRREKDRRLA